MKNMKHWMETLIRSKPVGGCVLGLLLLGAISPLQRVRAEEENDGRVALYLKATDPNDGKLFFTWRQVEGPKVRIADPAASKQITDGDKKKWVSETYYIPTEPGTYVFEVTVKNEDDVEIKKQFPPTVVTPPAPAPIAVAGKDKNVKEGQLVGLNGMDSKVGPDLTIKQWEWKVVQAPAKAKAVDPKKLKERQFEFKADVPGVYQFELRIFDGKRWSEPSRLMVTVKPNSLPPTIDDEPAPSETVPIELAAKPNVTPPKKKPVVKAVVPEGASLKVGQAVILDGSASLVEAGLKPEFVWSQESGPKPKVFSADQTKPFAKNREDVKNYPVWKFTPSQAGEYRFVLEITTLGDDDKPVVTSSEAVVYQVAGLNHPPVAKLFIERDTVEVGDVVKLDGSQSTDADHDKLSYLWGKVPGKTGPKTWSGTDGPKVEFTAEDVGDYSVQLTVSDGKESSTEQGVIHVGPANQAPVITLKANYDGVVDKAVLMEADVKDPENDPVDCKWNSTDVKIPDIYTKGTRLQFIPRKPGTFTFKITATDSKGKGDSASTVVTVKAVAVAPNLPPTAVLDGPKPASVTAGEKVKISGLRSSDPEKKLLTFHWTQELAEGSPKIPTMAPSEKDKFWEFTPTEAGKYIICLEVSDGALSSEPERFELTVIAENQPPVARIAPPESLKLEIGKTLVLDGSGSSDPESAKLTWHWKKVGGTATLELAGADQEKCSITASTAGTAEIELIVNDGVHNSAAERIEFSVQKPNHKPVALISGPIAAKLGEFVVLSAEKSTDEDNDEITKWVWSQAADGGPTIGLEGRDLHKREIRFKVDKPGTYVLTLQVADALGLSSESVTHRVEVKSLNRAPRAVASCDAVGAVSIGKEIKLSAKGSVDPEGSPLTYKWRKISGPDIQLPDEMTETTVITPKNAGDYEFELIVNDGENDSPPAKIAFAVKAANTPPVAVIGAIIPCEPGGKITLDSAESKDAANDRLTEIKWEQISGPKAKFPFRGMGKPMVDVELSTEGEYVFQLKVFDGKEWSEPVRATVKTRASNVAPIAMISEPTVRAEENVEVVVDGSASSDPDKGPKPLTYVWKQLEGVPKLELVSDGAKLRLTPKKMGNYKFELRVSDGKASSEPAFVNLVVLKAGTLPVAIPRATHNPLTAAVKGIKAGPDPFKDPTVLILDGSDSKAGLANKDAPLTYTWKQISGEDLRRDPKTMSEARVGMRIFTPGKYRFQLIISDGQNNSLPQFIDIDVLESDDLSPRPKNENKEGASLPPPRDDSKLAMTKDKEARVEGADGDKTALLSTLAELARSTEPDAEKNLVDALGSADVDVQTVAAKALCQRGMKSISALILVLEKGTPSARKKAHWALKELTPEVFPAEAPLWKEWWAKQQAAASKK